MKTPIRFQSRLLTRRSYKPSRLGRSVRISFRPTRPIIVPVLRDAAIHIAIRKS